MQPCAIPVPPALTDAVVRSCVIRALRQMADDLERQDLVKCARKSCIFTAKRSEMYEYGGGMFLCEACLEWEVENS
jgi:hypothetical protein